MVSEENTTVYDVAILGAGPAGLTAGIYAARSGLNALIVESLSPGGQMAQTEHLENYPGYATSTSGYELAEIMQGQAETFGANIVYDEVVSVDVEESIKTIHCASSDIKARSIVVATGARPAKLGLDNEEALVGSGVSYCATCDGNFFRDKVTCIIGGGDTAVADAIYLSRICKKVYLIVRRDVLRATAIYHDRLKAMDNVEILWNSLVDAIIEDDGAVCAIDVRNRLTEEVSRLETSAVFVAIGSVPNTEFLDGKVELDQKGYIVANEACATSVKGIFAAGDVRTKLLRQVATAVSDGANCIESVSEYLLEHDI